MAEVIAQSQLGARPLAPPAAPSTHPRTPTPGQLRGTNGADQPQTKYPVRLRVNITNPMNASLQRISRRLMIPEGILTRLALIQYLASNDPEYREE
jgi:hypothetical protein